MTKRTSIISYLISHISYLFSSLLSLIFSLAPCLAFGYTFATNRTSVSTEIFGYDRVVTPRPGKMLRTDPFVTLTNDVANKTFHLDDLRVTGYAGETSGSFNFFAAVKGANGKMVAATNAAGRALHFYWFDDRNHVAGWYDTDGMTSRWENVEFTPGQAFSVEGNGYTLETSGLVLDTSADCPVPPNTSIAVATPWAKRINLADIVMSGNGDHHVKGGVTIQTLDSAQRTTAKYSYYCVTNNCTADQYRAPGWYRNYGETVPITHADGITFDPGVAFWMQGYQANHDEPAVYCHFGVAPQSLNLNEEK